MHNQALIRLSHFSIKEHSEDIFSQLCPQVHSFQQKPRHFAQEVCQEEGCFQWFSPSRLTSFWFLLKKQEDTEKRQSVGTSSASLETEGTAKYTQGKIFKTDKSALFGVRREDLPQLLSLPSLVQPTVPIRNL